jgi:Rad3-related DNA helicase
MISKYNFLKFFPENCTPRPQQIKTFDKVDEIWSSGKKFALACLPTGSGKSHIAYTIGKASHHVDEERKNQILNYYIYKKNRNNEFLYDIDNANKAKFGSFILTVTRSLQDQYQQFFESLVSIKGKNNYQCAVDNNLTPDFAPCLFSKDLMQECFNCDRCPYYKTRNLGLVENVSILNYRAFFNLRPSLQQRQIYVFDEADRIEEELVSQFSLELNYQSLASEDIIFKKIIKDNRTEIYNWLLDIFLQTENKLLDNRTKAQLLAQKKGFDSLHLKLMQRIGKLNKIHNSIKHCIENWEECQYMIEDLKSDKIIFAPYNVKPLAQKIFNNADKILLMSATLTNYQEFCKNLGINQQEAEYFEIESSFDPQKSPIYCSSKFNLSYHNKADLNKIIESALEICNNHPNDKGVIHTHNNEIIQAMQKKIKNSKRFLIREYNVTNEEILKMHKNSLMPTVLVSPSLDTGVSLDGDLGRFQIILKAPYMPLSSKRIKKKFETNPQQYVMKMLNNLIQMCGRCTRAKEDHSITYILDGNITKAVLQNKKHLPKHFINRIQ